MNKSPYAPGVKPYHGEDVFIAFIITDSSQARCRVCDGVSHGQVDCGTSRSVSSMRPVGDSTPLVATHLDMVAGTVSGAHTPSGSIPPYAKPEYEGCKTWVDLEHESPANGPPIRGCAGID